MKHLRRLLLLSAALLIGGGLGHILLSESDPIKTIVFILACIALGEVFYQIDKRFSEK